MNQTLKICNQCKYYTKDHRANGGYWDGCLRLGMETHPIHGYKQPINLLNCTVERMKVGWVFNRDRCGPEGKYWEAKNETN